MKFEVEFNMEMEVEFKDPEKAKKFFINSEWSNFFWSVSDLEELVEYICTGFHNESEYYDIDCKSMVRTVEGFGVFVKNAGIYTASCEKEFGDIIIKITNDLDVEYVTEL